MTAMQIEIAPKLQAFGRPCRRKGAKGGRGSAKSWGVARLLLGMGLASRERILCAREIQKSIKDSVHKLLSDQVAALGMSDFYEVQRDVIKGPRGTEFLFCGLQDHTADSLKSFEGVTRCWVEEAHTVSARSWEILIPTIRAPGSEIWATWNPETPDDPVEAEFTNNPDALVVEMNWRDNPWFPPELDAERLRLQKINPDLYAHVWEGDFRSAAGLMFKRDWFRHYDRAPSPLSIFLSTDYAVTEDAGDFTELGIFGMSVTGDLYVLDWWSGQTAPETWIEAALRLVKLHKPRLWLEEAGVIHRALDGAINKRMRESNTYTARQAVPSASNKASRALGFAARASAGAVYLPKDKPWAKRLLEQLCAFNGDDGRVDDMVDVCSLIGRALDDMADPMPERTETRETIIPFSRAHIEGMDREQRWLDEQKSRYYR